MAFGKNQIHLGIDIGTTSIKIVELQKKGESLILKNYGEYYSPPSSLKEGGPASAQKSIIPFFEDEIANIIRKILSEAEIETKFCTFSLPVFSSFFTVIELPLMKPEEISNAVKFQAHQYIPVPLGEVVLDWNVIEEEKSIAEEKIKILLVAIPKDVIEKYRKVAEIAGLSLDAMEIESFSEVRSLVKNTQEPLIIVNIGGRITNVIIVEGGFIRVCHNLEFSSLNLVKAISEELGISFEKAKELKEQKGLKQDIENSVRRFLTPVIDRIIFDAKRSIDTYLARDSGKRIEKIILSGGTVNMPGLVDYFIEGTKIKTEIATPFSDIKYPSALDSVVKKMSPSFAVATGLALRGFVAKE